MNNSKPAKKQKLAKIAWNNPLGWSMYEVQRAIRENVTERVIIREYGNLHFCGLLPVLWVVVGEYVGR